jgi:hypothetical protein
MIKLEKFTGTKTYMYPNGTIATPERIQQDFPAVDVFPHVIEVNGNVCGAVMELGALRQIHNINEALTEDEAIVAIQAILNTPPPIPEPSAEERIAAAMEYQNLLSL